MSLDTKMVAFYPYSQPSERWREWTFELIGQRKAEELVAAGEADAVIRMKDGLLQVVGYRAKQPARLSRPSPTTLTRGTMDAVTNDGERHGWERREVAKYHLWPFEYDRRNGATVGPRITEADQARARGLLGRAA